MKQLLLMALAVTLAGCATPRIDKTQEDWKVREYKGKTKEQLVSAAREVVRLADPTDVRFENTLDGFKAVRSSLGYYVVKNDIDMYTFNFIAQEKNGITRTRIEIEEQEIDQSLLTLGFPVGTVGKPDYPYIYELFYSRIEYLLGIKDIWHKCDSAVSRVSATYALPNNAQQLGMASLCGNFADDKVPDMASKKIELF